METSTGTEEKIIKAATDIFLKKGKDGARMQEIADRAGINKALLHYYFRSKEKLHEEVFRNELKTFFRGVLGTFKESEDIQTFIKSFVHHYIDNIARRPRLIRFIIWEIEQGGENLSKIILETMQENNYQSKQILTKIQTEISANRIRRIDPPNLIVSLIGMCLFPFIAKPIIDSIFPHVNVTSSEFLNRRKEEIFNLVWTGIKPEPDTFKDQSGDSIWLIK
jgi:AcrR family transcriptional regulator